MSDLAFPCLMVGKEEGGRSFNKSGFRSQAGTVGDSFQGATDSELAGHCKQMVYPKEIAVLSNWVLASNLA